MTDPADVQFLAACRLLAGLRSAGIRLVVISPGARSLPLALAARRVAGLRVLTARDERAAAFLALGAARASGVPAVTIATSGTAGAHWHPAILEADAAAIPLVALTADRPPELRARSAPQTVDQVDLFGRTVRLALEIGALGDPGLPGESLAASARIAVRAALGPPAGPVHLNVSLRKPLDPSDRALREEVPGDRPAIPVVAPQVLPAAAAVEAIAPRVAGARRLAIVAGPDVPWRGLPAGRLRELATRSGAVALCEAGSGAAWAAESGFPLVTAFEPLVRAPAARERLLPDVLIQLGPPPTSKGLDAWSGGRHAPERIVIAPAGIPDPWHDAAILAAEPLAGLAALLDAAQPASDPGWSRAWRDALQALERARDRILRSAPGSRPLDEPHTVARVLSRLASGRHVLLANSLPVREAELFVAERPEARSVITQRGASGIDGLIAGAAGAAVATGEPVLALLGDVAALHDLTSLLVLRELAAPVLVVVLDNRGGRIFEQLPFAGSGLEPAELETLCTMPPAIDFAAAGAAFGIPALRAADRSALDAALETAAGARGPFLLAIEVAPSSSARTTRALIDAVDAELRTADAP